MAINILMAALLTFVVCFAVAFFFLVFRRLMKDERMAEENERLKRDNKELKKKLYNQQKGGYE